MNRFLLLITLTALAAAAQNKGPAYTTAEQRIVDRLKLRALPDDQRAIVTRELALEIRALPPSGRKLQLASTLANYATEGDFGRDTLQQVTTTLEAAIREQPPASKPESPHIQLTQLVRYEGMKADLSAPAFKEVLRQLESDDALRGTHKFTLADLNGKPWSLADLKGKVVLVNFWATWCPPCRKEMPDLQTLYERFGPKGLVVLAISDEDSAKVKGFLADKPYTFPVLLDPGGATAKAYHLEGVPKTLLYDRAGKLAAQSIDMRTEAQFLQMLAAAGLK